MTTTYNGNDGAVTARAAVTITIPVDADPLTAAILNAAVKQLADICDHLETKAGLLDVPSTWSTGQTFIAGLQSTGVSPSGSAAILTGGSPNGSALVATGTGTGNAIQAGAGHIKLTGSNPSVTTGFTNTITPLNVCKAWANISVSNVGAVAVNAGFNVTSASLLNVHATNDCLLITLATPLTSAFGAAPTSLSKTTPTPYIPQSSVSGTGNTVSIWHYDAAGSIIEWGVGDGGIRVNVVVFGEQ